MDIKENFLEKDGGALRDIASQVQGNVFVEIGSWKGYSTSFLAGLIRERNGDLYCVDHWQGSKGVKEHEETVNCFEIFRHNMNELGLSKYVHPLVMESSLASRIFADNIADLIFIDADHHYKEIVSDIRNWWPKLKKGGILCGHDAEVFYSIYHDQPLLDRFVNEEFVFAKRTMDDRHGRGIHPGVVRALYDIFGDRHSLANGANIWSIRKEDNGNETR